MMPGRNPIHKLQKLVGVKKSQRTPPPSPAATGATAENSERSARRRRTSVQAFQDLGAIVASPSSPAPQLEVVMCLLQRVQPLSRNQREMAVEGACLSMPSLPAELVNSMLEVPRADVERLHTALGEASEAVEAESTPSDGGGLSLLGAALPTALAAHRMLLALRCLQVRADRRRRRRQD